MNFKGIAFMNDQNMFLYLILFCYFFNVIQSFMCDFEQTNSCTWNIQGNSIITSSLNGLANSNGKFLLFNSQPNYKYENIGNNEILIATLESPLLDSSNPSCTLQFDINTGEFEQGLIKIILKTDEKQPDFEINKITGNNLKRWKTHSSSIRNTNYGSYRVLIEIVGKNQDLKQNSYIAFDNLALNNCIQENHLNAPSDCHFKCSSDGKCLSRDEICDIKTDCSGGEDEQSCEKLPKGSYCSFISNDICGWSNGDNNDNSVGKWVIEHDGKSSYIKADFLQLKTPFGKSITIKSPTFQHIPLYHSQHNSAYFNSCLIRFTYLLSSPTTELSLDLIENDPRFHHSGKHIHLWRKFLESNIKTRTVDWSRVSLNMPYNISNNYRVEFIATLGIRGLGKEIIAIKDISLSKECFGIDVPENETRKLPRDPIVLPVEDTFLIPSNQSLLNYHFGTCNSKGRIGPKHHQCKSYYSNTTTSVGVIENISPIKWNGTQIWTVPKSGFYSVFAKGADGGHGLKIGALGGKGALVRGVFSWNAGDTIILLAGQAGINACRSDLPSKLKNRCESNPNISPLRDSKYNFGGGGGGGGATFVMKLHDSIFPVPLLIGSGGGGGGSGNLENAFLKGHNGKGIKIDALGLPGLGALGGGGWNGTSHEITKGKSFLYGAEGGMVCNASKDFGTNGGFGGGGGGCSSGGAGGGYQGGNSFDDKGSGGDGGYSFINTKIAYLSLVSKENIDVDSDGKVSIFPQIDKCCNNKYPCVVIGQTPNGEQIYNCICPGFKFHPNTCIEEIGDELSILLLILLISLTIIIIFGLIIAIFGFSRYKTNNGANGRSNVNRDASASHLLSGSSTDVQLSRLRNGHNIITEYNPNYEFGGSTCTLQDLREVPREKLTLIKALGQGAFGEVYQGYLHNMPGEITDELSVAVKTLPEYSANNQAEIDFLMEALIMSKFKHRNIVRFIGVCFEKMPRFIVLELLSGGDLKTFLRENRSSATRQTTLCMGDLLVMGLDVARGCQYLEENHFIHRDIAARNCLLTNKNKTLVNGTVNMMNGVFNLNNFNNGYNGSGIVVKIADFGMARDIYRADYYRKGGKAMLPVKWMPPEAFLDGIFTSKTDVWSFGVLLWEVMSMGYMPYPGRGNQEVMQLVTAGGRLEPPNQSTPPQVYAIMSQCWHPVPDQRPSFSTIIERLSYCLQDPDVLNVKLPIFHRAPSMEKDMTLMRPAPDTTDYLVPNPCSNSTSNYSMSTEKTELLSPDTCSTFSTNDDNNAKLLEFMDDNNSPPVIPPRSGNWKDTSFVNQKNYQSNNFQKPKIDNISGTNEESTNSNNNPSGQQSLLLDASALIQNPSRYVNVNVHDDNVNPNTTVKLNSQQISC